MLVIVSRSGLWLVVSGCSLLVVCCMSLFVVGCWLLLVVCCSSFCLFVGLFFVVVCWLLVVVRCALCVV